MFLLTDNCTDLTYELIHFWKEAQKEENDKTVLSQLDKSYFVQILNDAFFGMYPVQDLVEPVKLSGGTVHVSRR